MSSLLNNPGFVTALVALIAALAGYVRQRTESARQAEHLAALQRQADRSSQALAAPDPSLAGSTVVRVAPGAGTVHVETGVPAGLPAAAPPLDAAEGA